VVGILTALTRPPEARFSARDDLHGDRRLTAPASSSIRDDPPSGLPPDSPISIIPGWGISMIESGNFS
jgi:hypothetical protein